METHRKTRADAHVEGLTADGEHERHGPLDPGRRESGSGPGDRTEAGGGEGVGLACPTYPTHLTD
jgi:hypothetical protein